MEITYILTSACALSSPGPLPAEVRAARCRLAGCQSAGTFCQSPAAPGPLLSRQGCVSVRAMRLSAGPRCVRD